YVMLPANFLTRHLFLAILWWIIAYIITRIPQKRLVAPCTLEKAVEDRSPSDINAVWYVAIQ
ncbi:MAG: hypothetical protein MUP21_07145, partial [Dehalococcoidia bacterium]|nr:hypothetical protein [Dehalococcoidia bacterium]